MGNSTTDLTLLRESKKYQRQLQAYYISSQSKQDFNYHGSNNGENSWMQKLSNSTKIVSDNFSFLSVDPGAIISTFKLQSHPQDSVLKTQINQQDQEAIVFRVYQGTNSLRYTN